MVKWRCKTIIAVALITLVILLINNSIGISSSQDTIKYNPQTVYGARVYKLYYPGIIGARGIGEIRKAALNSYQRLWTYMAITLYIPDGSYAFVEAGLIRWKWSYSYHHYFFVTVKPIGGGKITYYLSSIEPEHFYEISIQKQGVFSDDWVITLFDLSSYNIVDGVYVNNIIPYGHRVSSEIESNNNNIPVGSGYMLNYWCFMIYAERGDGLYYKPDYKALDIQGTEIYGLPVNIHYGQGYNGYGYWWTVKN